MYFPVKFSGPVSGSNSDSQQSSEFPPPIPQNPPPSDTTAFSQRNPFGARTQRIWTSSTDLPNMSMRVETTVRQWSTPVQKVVEGRPPLPI
ncbi:hypothetical protein AB6A40_007976 [Gnathostoma spinigerum]|uniref:Uncharacterized protein n=1 Tax=Gnathostoma spinigerum TaxID=75299 RepID=A0ABD6EQ19_9BILA